MTISNRTLEDHQVVSGTGLKRFLDVFVAVTALLGLFPLLILIAAAIRLEDGAPAIFWQVRVGLRGAPFQIAKFRSMKVRQGARRSELTVAGDPRITRVGAFIRQYKIDELPQLWNVLLGDMSLVGPRPEAPSLLEYYTPAQRRTILSLRPGITDWASLILRNENEALAATSDPVGYYREVLTPIKCKFWECYRAEQSVLTDCRILLATLWAVAAPHARNPWLSSAARMISQQLALPRGSRELGS